MKAAPNRALYVLSLFALSTQWMLVSASNTFLDASTFDGFCRNSALIAVVSLVLWRGVSDWDIGRARDALKDSLWWAIVSFSLSRLLSAALNGQSILNTPDLVPWVMAPLLYAWSKTIPLYLSIASARIVAPAYVLVFFDQQNENYFAQQVMPMAALEATGDALLGCAFFLGTALFLNVFATARSAMVASVAAVVYRIRRSAPLWIVVPAACLSIVALVMVLERRSTNLSHYRLDLIVEGWRLFLRSPLVGNGPDLSYVLKDGHTERFAHHWPISIAAEQGLVGLACVLAMAVTITRRWNNYPPNVQMLLVMLAVWSIFDEPFRHLGVLFPCCLGLAGIPLKQGAQRKEASPWNHANVSASRKLLQSLVRRAP